MFGAMFANMPNVVKNLLIINVLFFLAKAVANSRGIDLSVILGLHYFDSPDFRPYQIATHFFMHGDLMHIFFNMFSLVMLGAHLERIWGPKRFLIFYFVTALGAAALHQGVLAIEIYNAAGTLTPISDGLVECHPGIMAMDCQYSNVLTHDQFKHAASAYTNVVGASGAIYGLLMAFAMLFPNTEFMLLFPPIPIKAKWFALILGLIALYSGYQNSSGDSVAHFAHLGGMLFGFIMIKIWQRDKSNFY
jgi:membrane associated rhomboid family serine protease